MAELNTYGDLKKVIKAISLKQKGEKIGQVALDTVVGFIPGAEAAKTTFDFIKAAFSKPDTKKTNTWLDKLDIDDQMSAIIDDTVENGFLKVLANTLENESDTKPLESDFNMNAKMVDYLKNEYGGRTVTGIKENKMKKSDLKKLIKEQILNELETGKPEVVTLSKYLATTGKTALSNINDINELESVLNMIFDGMNTALKSSSKLTPLLNKLKTKFK
jgi:hypothetical protein